MKKMINSYCISKFKRIVEGLLFAIISASALILCLNHINNQTQSQISVIMTFCVAMISMLMGLSSLFHKEEVPEEGDII
jgi:predicted permease